MSKFNVVDKRGSRAAMSPIATESTPSGETHEGGAGYARTAKGELFLLAVSNMVGEGTFYEAGKARDGRYAALVRQVAVADPVWMLGFLGWLRGEGNMRSASLVGAAEAVFARLAAQFIDPPGHQGVNRKMVAAVLQRADEPGELLAYWTATFGRAIPKPVKRGVADAVRRLYNEYGLLKYDTASHGFRFADVIDLVHPTPTAPWQGDLFRYALDRRHGRETDMDVLVRGLPMVLSNTALRAGVANGKEHLLLNPDTLKGAGMTWEDALSLAGSKVPKAKLWAALAPTMGYMALLRNLRNFDEAGLPDDVAAAVAARLADPAQVARSRQFPYRFLAAYENAPSLRWGQALDQALNASLSNVPALPGRTLVLIDTSASMTQTGMSGKSTMTPAKAAAVFGVVLAARCGADLFGFADGTFRHQVPKGASVLREVDRFVKRTGEVGHGTRMVEAVWATFAKHDRVFILSDMQTFPATASARHAWIAGGSADVSSAVPADVPMYAFNLVGYQRGAMPVGSGNRHEMGGLTDAAFRMVPLLEAGRNATWPWLASS